MSESNIVEFVGTSVFGGHLESYCHVLMLSFAWYVVSSLNSSELNCKRKLSQSWQVLHSVCAFEQASKDQ